MLTELFALGHVCDLVQTGGVHAADRCGAARVPGVVRAVRADAELPARVRNRHTTDGDEGLMYDPGYTDYRDGRLQPPEEEERDCCLH